MSTENVLQMKKVLFKKMGDVLKPWINILCKIAFILFYEMPTIWSSVVNKAILEQVKVTE